MIKIAMFDTKPYDMQSFLPYSQGKCVIKFFETKLDESTAGLAHGFDCVSVFVNDAVDRAVIDALVESGVRLVALRCAGFNNVDAEYARGKITIVRVPSYSPEAVAEHTMALLLSSIRRIHKAYNRTREFNFSIVGLTGMTLRGKTVGIVGTGKIGRAFLSICRGFGMRILAYDKYPDETLDAEYVPLEVLFRESDVISLHCPLTEENYHMIRRETIELCRPGVILLNTSRGALIDAEDLLAGIKEKRIGAACLDVYEEESELFFRDRSGHILRDDILARLLSMPNVLLTAHQAFLTEEALASIAKTTMENICAFFLEEKTQNEVIFSENKVVL